MNRYFGVHVLDGEWHALLPRYLLLSDRIEDERILDIGCGTGIGSSLLLELGAERVDGVDYRPGVLDLANIKHAKENLDFHMMLWEDLDFSDDRFDMVVCLDPTTPVTDPNLLEEVSRVLTDDGEYVCAIERRTIEGFESLLPRYGYSAPAENVELGEREEQAPQIGELTNYFDELNRVLQRPEYSYVFEPEQIDESAEEAEQIPVDYTLCTEDSHIAGVELIFCGPEEMEEPGSTSIRLPYYRLAERLSTVIRDLNVRQGPGADEAPLEGPVEASVEPETSPEPTTREETTSNWNGDSTTNVQDRPDRSEEESPERVEQELNRLSGAYRQLHQNFEQLREQTQSAMVAQERSIDQIVQMFRQWAAEQEDVDWEADVDTGASPHAETDVYEADQIREAARDFEEEGDAEETSREELESEVERLDEERQQLREQMEKRDEEIDKLREELEALREDSDAASADEAGDEDSDASEESGEASDVDEEDDAESEEEQD